MGLVPIYCLPYSSPQLLQTQSLCFLDANISNYLPRSPQKLEQVLSKKEASCFIVNSSELNCHFSVFAQFV